MKVPLKDLQIVMGGQKGDKGGPPSGPPPDAHVIPNDDDQGDDTDQQDDDADESDGGESGEQQDSKSGDKKSNDSKIVRVKGRIRGSHDEMVDGTKDHNVLDGSEEGNDKNTRLDDPDKIIKNAQREMERATKSPDGKGGSGNAPLVKEIIYDKRNYKEVLKEIFGSTSSTGPRSYTKPIRRLATQPFPRPGRVAKPQLGNVILALDTSGSITPGMISMFLGNAQRIAEQFKHKGLTIRVVLYIEKVYKVIDFKPEDTKGTKLAEWLRKNINKSGGNYFPDVMKSINSMVDLKKFKGIVYLTDGFEVIDKGFTLPPMKNIFLIDGPVGESYGNSDFLSYVQKQNPGGKKVDIYQINTSL